MMQRDAVSSNIKSELAFTYFLFPTMIASMSLVLIHKTTKLTHFLIISFVVLVCCYYLLLLSFVVLVFCYFHLLLLYFVVFAICCYYRFVVIVDFYCPFSAGAFFFFTLSFSIEKVEK